MRDALASKDVAPEAVVASVQRRFGDKVVAYDPSDAEANKLAVVKGYVVVHGSQLSKEEWANVKAVQAILPAGKVTPSPKPFGENGRMLETYLRSEWTPAMERVADYAKRAVHETVGVTAMSVMFAKDRGWGFAACYGGGVETPTDALTDEAPMMKGGIRRLIINLAAFDSKFCEKNAPSTESGRDAGVALDELLIHEFGHEIESDHLSAKYYAALCKVGAKLKAWAMAGGAP